MFSVCPMSSVVERGIAVISCLSVCPSVTLVDCDHKIWNSSKIISRMISLGTWLAADPNVTDLLQSEHPQILARIGAGYGKLSIFNL